MAKEKEADGEQIPAETKSHPKETPSSDEPRSKSESKSDQPKTSKDEPKLPSQSQAVSSAEKKPNNREPAPPASLSSFERKVVALVNAERTGEGLKPLKADVQLSGVARKKSADMRDSGYFSHQSPTYGSPFDMMSRFGVKYQAAAENIAAGQPSPESVVKGWMNSSGHRANILNPEFTHIGVGHVEGGSMEHYWTQQFIRK